MRFHEITEGILEPKEDFMQPFMYAVEDAAREYAEFLQDNNDVDDPEELASILEAMFEEEGLPITVHVGETGRNAIDWYIQAAQVVGNGEMDLILDPDSINGHWGPKTFIDVMRKTFEHETIHLQQRDRMGKEKYNTLPSGYMKGLEKFKKSGKERDLMRTYFRDPQELMAHGHDIYREVQASSNPQEALRNPEKYRDELPTYDKHRAIFPPNAKPLQRMLSYAARYFAKNA